MNKVNNIQTEFLQNYSESITTTTQPANNNFVSKLSDADLYQLCRQHGQAALKARHQFLGLLPEVNRRQLWKNKGFTSIFEFAAKLAGITEEQVRRVLNIEKRLTNMPALHQALITGKISTNKIAKVVSIATVENQEQLVEISQNLSTRALETLVRDEKSVHVNTKAQQFFPESNIELKTTTQERLKNLQDKGIDVDALINELLDHHQAQIDQKKTDLAQESKLSTVNTTKPNKSRYIPVKIKTLLQQEYGNKCAMANCKQKSTQIHHTLPYSISKSHNPNFLAPLCHEHHQIAHLVNIKISSYRTKQSFSKYTKR